MSPKGWVGAGVGIWWESECAGAARVPSNENTNKMNMFEFIELKITKCPIPVF